MTCILKSGMKKLKQILCLNYRIFKQDLYFEKYLIKLPFRYRMNLCKFRCGNHRLPVVTGRYYNIDRKSRVCTLCKSNFLGDEFHYIFECSAFNELRIKYVKRYFRIRPNTLKMNQLFTSTKLPTLINLAKFCKEIMLHF